MPGSYPVRRLDQCHLRTQIGEQPPAKRRALVGQVKYTNAVKRQGLLRGDSHSYATRELRSRGDAG